MNRFSQNLISYGKQTLEGFKKLQHLTLSQLRKVFSLMGRREKIAIVGLAIIALGNFYLSARNFYYARTVAAPASGGQLTEGLLGQPAYISPLLARQEPDLSLTNLVFAGLYKYDAAGNLVPDIADGKPVISSDEKQYTINLKRNVKWHNGSQMTADDVVYTIQTLQDPGVKSPLRPQWLSTTVEKLSDYQVKFTTKDVSGPFLQNLNLPILPKALWNGLDGQNFLVSRQNLEAVGAGPYAIKEIKKLASGKIDSITLVAFADYYGGQAKIEKIVVKFYDNEDDILNALHSGEITSYGFSSLVSNLYLEKGQPDLQIYSAPLPQFQVVFFNLNNKILADQTVRSALSLAANRREIIDKVFKGNALLPSSPLLFAWQNQNSQGEFNLEEARQILNAAGWVVDGKSGFRQKKNQILQFTLTTNDSLVNSKAAEIVANQWRALNINVALKLIPTKQLTEEVIKPRNFDILLFPQKFGADPDPFLFWHSSQVKDPGLNLTGFASPDADKLISQARTTTNQQVREQKYQQFNQLAAEKSPVIFLDQAVYTYAVDKNVKNINLQTLYEPSQRFYDLPNWYIEEKRMWK